MKAIIFIFLILLKYFEVSGQYKVLHISEENLVNIKIDGKANDWEWVDEKNVISNDLMNDVYGNSKSNVDDWDCEIIIGWNELTNRIYILAKIFDDVIVDSNKNSDMNDRLHLAVNPQNLIGGKYFDNAASTDMELYYDVIKASFSFNSSSNRLNMEGVYMPQWASEWSDYFQYAYTVEIIGNVGYLTTYELSLTLWDFWSESGPHDSKRTELHADKIIGLTLSFVDSDKTNNQREAEWVTLTTSAWYWDAAQISKFKLLPPLNEGISIYSIRKIIEY